MSAVDRYGFEMIAVSPTGRAAVRLGFPRRARRATRSAQAMVAMVADARVCRRRDRISAMTELELLVSRSTRAWAWLEDTVLDVAPEQANWWPPGTANSIAATYLHVVLNTDVEINRLALDRPPLIEGPLERRRGPGLPLRPRALRSLGPPRGPRLGGAAGLRAGRCTRRSSPPSMPSRPTPWSARST